MDSERFDRWAKLLAVRISRRTATVVVGAAAVASLTSPRWVLGQDDDDDQDNDDQGDDNGDDTPNDDGGQDSSDDDQADLQSGVELCKNVTTCKAVGINISNGNVTFNEVGPIPGGPYPQYWKWDGFNSGCRIVDHTDEELVALCEATYPRDPSKPLRYSCGGEYGCAACADFAVVGCK